MWRQVAVALLLLAVLVVVARLLGAHWDAIADASADLGALGWLIFIGAVAVLSAGCFPAAALSLTAGALFGPWPGLPLVMAGGFLGALLVYGLARGRLRRVIVDAVARRPRLAALDRMAGEHAVRLNVLTRLSPLNFGLACYTLAAGRSGLRSYAVGFLGAVPGMAFYVWLGWAARSAGAGQGPGTRTRLLLLAGSVAFFSLLIWLLARMVHRAWAGGTPTAAEAAVGGSGDSGQHVGGQDGGGQDLGGQDDRGHGDVGR